MREPVREWLVAADDRTGAFEVAALFAAVVGPVAVTTSPQAGSGVVDIGSRRMSAKGAADVAARIDDSPSVWIAHKIDSTLRGNWAVELRARQHATGRRMVVLPGWPELGRTSVGGVVHVEGTPIGNVLDQLPNADLLSDDAELRAWLAGDGTIAVCDVPTTEAMNAAAEALVGHDVLLAGPAGPIGAAFAARCEAKATPHWALDEMQPALVICGSVNPVSREQLQRLSDALPGVAVMATPVPDGALHHQAMVELVADARVRIAELQPRTLVIVGGDTAAELLGPAARVVSGFASPGMPFIKAHADDPNIITKAGGFGEPYALVYLLVSEND